MQTGYDKFPYFRDNGQKMAQNSFNFVAGLHVRHNLASRFASRAALVPYNEV